MSSSADTLPPPMTELRIAELCSRDITDGVPLFPEIEDRGELAIGDYVILTFLVEEEDNPSKKECFAFPAKIVLGDDGDLQADPCDCELWSQGWKRPQTQKITADLKLRGLREDEGDDRNTQLSTSWPEPEHMLERCHARLYEKNAGFRSAMQIGKGSERRTNAERSGLLRQMMRNLLSLTPNQWRVMRPVDVDKLTDEEISRFEACINKAINQVSSDRVQVSSNLGKTNTNIKYVSLMMDMATSRFGPDPPAGQQDGQGGDEEPDDDREVKALKDLIIQQGKTHSKELEKQSKELEKVYAMLNAMSLQLKIRERLSPEGRIQPRIMKVPADHSCLFHALKIIADKLQNPGHPIDVNGNQARVARQVMLWHAKKVWDSDRELWKDHFGDESFEEFYARHLRTPSTNNWGGASEIGLFGKEFPELDIRQITARQDGPAAVISLAADKQKLKKVAFLIWTGSHYDIGAAKIWTGAEEVGGLNKVVFDIDEAEKIQSLLLSHIAENKKKSVSFAPPPPRSNPGQDPEDAKTEFMKQVEKDMTGEGDGDWSVFEKEDKRQRQEKKRKEKARKEREGREKKEKEQRERQEQEIVKRQEAILVQQSIALRAAQAQASQIQQSLQVQQSRQMVSAVQQAPVVPHQVPHQPQQSIQHQGMSYAQALQGVSAARQAPPTVVHAPMHPPSQTSQSVPGTGEFDIFLGGSSVVPAIVIFTKESPARVESMFQKLAPAAAGLIKASVKRGQGTSGERCEVHCLQGDVPTLQAAVHPLRSKGVRIDVFKRQQPRRDQGAGLAGQAATGVEEAIRRAGVCRQYYYNQPCNRSVCRFKCYGSQLPQYPVSPC